MRIKRSVNALKKRRSILKQAKGYRGSKSKLYRIAREAVMKSGQYAYVGRRLKKRNFRSLWITRINAACRMNDISYSKFISGLNKAGVEVNRKMLSELAIDDMKGFKAYVDIANDALNGKITKKEVVKKEAPKSTKTVEKKEAPAKKETTKKEDKKDYSKMTLAELKEVAKSQDVKGYSTMKKADLLAAIK